MKENQDLMKTETSTTGTHIQKGVLLEQKIFLMTKEVKGPTKGLMTEILEEIQKVNLIAQTFMIQFFLI